MAWSATADEGYDLYVVLDATIGLNKQEGDDAPAEVVPQETREVQFRINVNDLALLRGLGEVVASRADGATLELVVRLP